MKNIALALILGVAACATVPPASAGNGKYYNVNVYSASATMALNGQLTMANPTQLSSGPVITLNASSGSIVGNYVTLTPGAAPVVVTTGTIYFDTSLGVPRISENGSTFVTLATGSVSGNFINLQGSTPGAQQSGNLNISGTGIFGNTSETNDTATTLTVLGTTTVQGNAFSVGGSSFTVSGGNATVAYTMTATNFVGSGAGLTGLLTPSVQASSVTAGTFAAGVFLPAGQLTGGPMASSVLPSTVAFTSVANNFTQGQTLSAQSGQNVLNVNPGVSGTLAGVVISSAASGIDGLKVFDTGASVAHELQGDNAYLAEQGAGNLGVGTTSPQYKADINGTMRATNSIISSTESVLGNAFSVGGSSFVV